LSSSLISLIITLLMMLGPNQRARALRSIGASKALKKSAKKTIRNRLSGKKAGGKTTKKGKGKKHHKGRSSKGRKSTRHKERVSFIPKSGPNKGKRVTFFAKHRV